MPRIQSEETVLFNYCEYFTPDFEHDCVEAVWSFRPGKLGKYLVLPDGRVDLVARFHVGDNETVSHIRLIVAGPASRSSLVPATPRTGFLGVRFRPGWGVICSDLILESFATRRCSMNRYVRRSVRLLYHWYRREMSVNFNRCCLIRHVRWLHAYNLVAASLARPTRLEFSKIATENPRSRP